ncbi:probable pseudouridine-5'-phosphatase [Drosophila madeirensis]|uniref:Probable pseudouridine-5'-phosphatase n=1 Tax=Drosophila madeirensis TaxID=30013 RepID=A0AAU9FIC2_DROMD
MCNRCRRPPPPCPICCPPSCCEPRICYCIFDLESAVFDTRNIYRRAVIDIAASYNREVPELVLLPIGVMATGEMAELIVRKCKIPVTWEQFLLQVNERASELISNPPLMDGVERLVRHLHKCCITLALISSSCEKLYCQKIRGREAFFEHFETLICADDPQLKRPKPEPDVYLIAMSRLGEADTSNTLVFDGSIKGVQAAADARLKVIMVPERGLPYCWSELAALRLESLEEFKPEWFGMAPLSKEAPRPKPKPRPVAKSPGQPVDKQESKEQQESRDEQQSKEQQQEGDAAGTEEKKPKVLEIAEDDAADKEETGSKRASRNWDKIRSSVRKSLRPSRKVEKDNASTKE